MRAPAMVALLLLGASPLGAQDVHLLIVTGLGGEPSYREQFYAWGAMLRDAAISRYGLPESHVRLLSERTERDTVRIASRSTAENLNAEIERLESASTPGDLVFIILVGHGSARGDEVRFNLPGPDISGEDLADVLTRLNDRTVVLVNAFSSSGDLVPVLSGSGRVVITATSSGGERYVSRFPGYFVGAFAEGGADLDKDNRISVFEAFEYARREVQRYYESQNQLAPEHALLDDDGDGEGSREPDPSTGDGSLARRIFLVGGTGRDVLARPDSADAETLALFERKERLESRIEELRGERETLGREAYESQLEELLVELALTSRQIRERQGGESQ